MYPMKHAEIASSSENTESVQELKPKEAEEISTSHLSTLVPRKYTWSL